MRILFTSNPGFGHVHPMVPLARALADRGHEVRWAVARDACPRIEAAGFETYPAGMAGDERRAAFDRCLAEASSLPPERRPDHMFPAFFGEACTPPMLGDLLPAVDDWKPALIVNDASELAAPLAAQLGGVPHVTHAFGALLPAGRVTAAADVVAPLWREHGLEPRPYAGSYDHPYLDIYPPSMRFGSYEHVPQVQEGLGRLQVDVLVTVGPAADPASLGAVPPNVRVERYVPQTAVLPHCAVVVSHAGSGTFLASLGLGIPQLCLPQAADQFINAGQGTAAGAALSLTPAEASADAIAGAVGRLLTEPAFRDAAGRVRDEIEGMPGPDDVAAVLEDLC